MATIIIDKVTQILLAIGAAVLAAMMLLTSADVVMRYILNRPIPGAFELAEYMMAFIVPFSIAYCASLKGHVSVELFIKKTPKSFQKILGLFTSFITLIFAALVAWQNILYIGETYTDHLASSVLLIPAYPFIIPVSIGIGVYAFITMHQLFDSTPEVKNR